MSDLYDVILFGVRGEAEDYEHAKRKIGDLLELDPGKIEEAINTHTGLVIHNGVSQDIARKLQAGLAKVGGVCNIRPASRSIHRLELVPLEIKEDKPSFDCPSCGFHEEHDNPDDMPVSCPSCGVVPQKYDRVQDEKAERERIKRRLLETHKAREQQGLDEYERRQQEARRIALEEEIRKELGLPRSLTTRGRLISTAAALWTTGVAMGIGSILTYQMLMAPLGPPSAPVPPKVAANPGAAMAVGADLAAKQAPMGGVPPEDELAMQMASFAQSLPVIPPEVLQHVAPTATPAAGPAATVTPDTGELTITAAATPVIRPTLSPQAIRDAQRHDPVWDRFLTLSSKRLLEANQVDKAWFLAQSIPDGRAKWAAQLAVVDHLNHQGDIPKRNQCLDQIEAQIMAVPAIPSRVEGLGMLAKAIHDVGDLKRSGDADRKAEKLVSEVTLEQGKISALGLIAVYRNAAGQDSRAETALHEANRLIAGIKEPTARLAATIDLADSYIHANRRPAATAILNGATQLAERIAESDRRSAFYRDIAVAFGRANDVESALAVAVRQVSQDARDQTILDVLEAELGNGEPYLGLRAADELETPIYQARGRAALAWSLETENRLDAFAEENLNRAVTASEHISHAIDQAIVQATLSRFAAWMKSPAVDAEGLGKKAVEAATRVDDPASRDLIWALLATEQARGHMTLASHANASQITNAELSKSITDELAQLRQISDNLK